MSSVTKRSMTGGLLEQQLEQMEVAVFKVSHYRQFPLGLGWARTEYSTRQQTRSGRVMINPRKQEERRMKRALVPIGSLPALLLCTAVLAQAPPLHCDGGVRARFEAEGMSEVVEEFRRSL